MWGAPDGSFGISLMDENEAVVWEKGTVPSAKLAELSAKLAELHTLHQAGALTGEEYERAKAKLLSGP